MPVSLSVVTPERTILERDDVLRITAPASEGQITILPGHAALMTSLGLGELTVLAADGPAYMAVHGGILQVVDDHVSVLADGAEHVEEIDEARAEAARERAQLRVTDRSDVGREIDLLRAQASLQRSLLRLRVRRRRSGVGVPSQS